jgi:CRISPR-associated endonuclease/helicase Cas3
MGQKRISCLSNNIIYSHPNKPLEDHLSSVGRLSQEILSSKKFNLESYIRESVLSDISYLIGITHDSAKASSYFQDYIREEDEEKRRKLKNKPETHHACLSAIFTYYTIKKYLSDKGLLDAGYYKYLPILSFLVVKRHHGNLNNTDDEIIDFDEGILEKQTKAIYFDNLNGIYKRLVSKVGIRFDCSFLKEKILTEKPAYIYDKISGYKREYKKDIEKEKKLIRDMEDNHTLFYYFITMLLYSVLLDADKTDAAELKKIARVEIDENIVDNYKKANFKRDGNIINQIRNSIYDEVTSKVGEMSLEKDKILSLHVPTGTGKTLTSLSFAIKLKKRIKKKKDYNPRIIYALPFLSIIDQNFNIFEKVFESVDGEIPPSNILLKHHHLSDIIYKAKEDEFENTDRNISKDLLLIEGWNSEIIVTTFMQLFHSLISNRNRAIRKIHNITNSIIILDEVQAIPHKYWVLLNKTIKFFAEHFNTYFIFVTATQPLIFNEKVGEITSLVEKKKRYFDILNRITLTVNLGYCTIDDLKLILKEDILRNPDKNFLVVLNTINSSKKIYEYIKDLQVEDVRLYYLSTNIIPKERLERIKKIKEEKKYRQIIISTQLIEAGVDISVDIAYRDFGPLDAINQIAGRCNRNFGNEKGIVKVFLLREDNNGRTYYPHSIYENFITSKTKDIFKDREDKIEEPELLKLSEDYFNKINSGKSDDYSQKILKDVEALRFEELSKFQLIEEDYYKIDTFVEVDDEAKEVWERYLSLISDKTMPPFERKKEFLKIKREFYDYVISIPSKFKNNLTDFDDKLELGYISSEELDQLYSLETGFKREDTDSSNGGTMFI